MSQILAERVKAALSANQLAVIIGVRGTGKTNAADLLEAEWRSVDMTVIRIDAAQVQYPEDLNYPLAKTLGCDPVSLRPSVQRDSAPVRVIVDRCDCLFDKPWVNHWQEQWRALLTDPDAQGALAAVLFGRPLFRQIAGGDASPLLNAGRIVSVAPLRQADLVGAHDLSDAMAGGVLKKTGGHPATSDLFAELLMRSRGNFKQAVKAFEKNHRSYLIETIQDHPVGGRAMLSEILRTKSVIHETALIQLHFADAHADGRAALDDLCASGLVRRDSSGDCSTGADLLRNIRGIAEAVNPPRMEVPAYVPSVMDAAWRCLFFSENALRKIVVDRLQAINAAWWILDVPPQVRAAAEGRRKSDGLVAASEEATVHPIMYLTMDELFAVVLSGWDRVFAAFFSPLTEETVRGLSQDFTAVRNRLAHSRPITQEQLLEFELLAKRLGLTQANSL